MFLSRPKLLSYPVSHQSSEMVQTEVEKLNQNENIIEQAAEEVNQSDDNSSFRLTAKAAVLQVTMEIIH